MQNDFKFDLIFSIGADEFCSEILKDCKLQKCLNPFDFVIGSDIYSRAVILFNEFYRFFDFRDFVKIDSLGEFDVYQNVYTNLIFKNTFKSEITFGVQHSDLKTEFEKQSAELLYKVINAQNILLVYIDSLKNYEVVNEHTLNNVLMKLKIKYPGKNFNILHFKQDINIPQMNFREFAISDKIGQVIGNFTSLNFETQQLEYNKIFFKNYLSKFKLNESFVQKIKEFFTT